MSLEKMDPVILEAESDNNNHRVTVMEQLKEAQKSGDQRKIHEAMLAADEKYKVRSRVSNITDFVPVIGSAKMIHEAVSGSQLGTQRKIEGWQRVIHGVSGAAFLAADLIGIGAIGSVAGKVLMRGALKGGEKLALQAAEKKLLQREGAELIASGDVRIEKAQKIGANDGDFYAKKSA